MADSEDVTRCICGSQDLVLDSSDVDVEDGGLFVQCDKCLVWQHGYCVGLIFESQVPETYFCELCRPDLHRIIQRPRKLRRSKYLGIPDASSPPRPDTDDQVPEPPRKRRSTMNSRDTAYDRQLEQALLLSAQQSGAPLTSRESSAARDGSKRPRTPSPEPGAETALLGNGREKKRKLPGVKREASDKKKRPSGAAKSRSATTQTLPATDDGNAIGSDVPGRPRSTGRDRSRRGISAADRAIAGGIDAPMVPSSGNPNGSGKDSREGTPSATELYLTPRKRTRATKAGTNTTAAARQVGSAASTLQALPLTQVKSIADMKKRVSALLEYLGRTQMEIAIERQEWTTFTETLGQDDKDWEVWQYGEGEGGTLEMMEQLTKALLAWEATYG
ncbi:Histone deacetylase complex subunit [Savitreella phatthalungensis]